MFFKYNKVRLQANLMGNQNVFSQVHFKDGSNVIVTDSNTRGKSSLINALVIGLGFDETAKGNVSALVNETIKVNGEEVQIFGAEIFLELQNAMGKTITIKRSLRPDVSKVLFVCETPLEQWNEEEKKNIM